MKKLLFFLFFLLPFSTFAAGSLNISKNDACNLDFGTPSNTYPYDGVSITGFSTPTSHGFIKQNNVIYYLIEAYVKGTQYSLYNYQCKNKQISKIMSPNDFTKIAQKLGIDAHAWYISDKYNLKGNTITIKYQYTNFNPDAEDVGENIIDVKVNLKTRKVTYLDKVNKRKTFLY